MIVAATEDPLPPLITADLDQRASQCLQQYENVEVKVRRIQLGIRCSVKLEKQILFCDTLSREKSVR